jgi:peptide/nickel transport system substrate-binding protein
MKKYASILLVFLLSFSLLLTGCGGGSQDADTKTPAEDPAAPAEPKTDVVIALQGEPSSLDVQYPDDGNMHFVTWNIFEPLYKLNGTTLEPDPCLATGYTIVDDLTWDFTLREGVKFHDGSDFTVEDAVFSVNRIIDPDFNSQKLSVFSTIERAEVKDDKTLRIITKTPDPILLKRMTMLDMLSKSFTESKTFDELTLVAMGTGPFKLDSWNRGLDITIVANENYWGEKPELQKATFRFIEEPITRLSALKTGEIDLAVNMYPEYADELPKIFTEIGNETYWIRFNQYSGWMKDKNMRLAANYAVDRQGLADALFLGYASPCQGQMGRPGYVGFSEKVADYGYNPEKAKELLAAAGYNGEVVELLSERGRWLKDGEVTEAVAAQLTEAGFNVNTKFVSWNEWLDTLFDKAKIHDMQYSSTSNEFFDMDRTLSTIVHSVGTQSAVKNADIDKMIDDARVEMDPAKRQELYDELAQTLHDDPFGIYLLFLNDLHGGAANLEWTPRQDSRVYVSEMSFS